MSIFATRQEIGTLVTMALLKSTLFSLFLFSSTLQANESAVREVFDGYGQAMLAKEGEEAGAFYDAVAGQITQRKPGVDPWQPLGE